MTTELTDDPNNIVGISELVNVRHCKVDLNRDEIEKSLLKNTTFKPVSQNDFNVTLSDISKEMGIDFDDNLIETKSTNNMSNNMSNNNGGWNKPSPLIQNLPNFSKPTLPSFNSLNPSNQSSFNLNQKPLLPIPSSTINVGKEDEDESEELDDESEESEEQGIDMKSTDYAPSMKYQTEEQRRKSHINHVIGNMDDGEDFNFDKEKEEDDRNVLLEKIHTLFGSLKKNKNVHLKGIKMPKGDEPIETLRNLNKLLQRKHDRVRFSSVFEEVAGLSARGLEGIFNGERRIAGYAPDLRGWHHTVNIKLRGMKYETSQVVSDIFQNYNINPIWRILIELIPSMFLYSSQKKEQNDMGIGSESSRKETLDELDKINQEFQTDESSSSESSSSEEK